MEDKIADGDFTQAINELENDIRKKMDGCGTSSDKNDWITDCDAQFEVRPLIDDVILDLKALIP